MTTTSPSRSTLAARETPAPSSITLALRAAEFALLYGGVPVLFLYDAVPQVGLIPFLLGTGLLLGLWLRLDPTFDNARFGRARSIKTHWGWMWRVFLAGAVLLTLLTLILFPDRLLAFPLRAFPFYMIVMLAYPIFSVYPQEIIFRTFLFHRYQMLFRHPAALIAASAVAFGWGHVFFLANPVMSVLLSGMGGALFAWTYFRTRSTLACAIEHAMYGDFIFTIGLGALFFTGARG